MNNVLQIILILMITPFFVSAQSTFQLKKSKITISGTSTLHDWTSDVTEVKTKANLTVEGNVLGSIKSMELEIPAVGIKSTKGKKMDNKTYDALKAELNPNILFKLLKVNSMTFKNGAYLISASANLTVAGVTKVIQLEVNGTMVDAQTISFHGKKSLKMTDFDMDPPTALLGTIKTGDEVTVEFDITLGLNGTL